MARDRKTKTPSERPFPELLTAKEVLQICRVETTAPRRTLMAWRREGLDAVRVGNAYRYDRRAVLRFLDERVLPGRHIRVSQVALQLRLNATWLQTQIEEGLLPGKISVDGVAVADPLAIRWAMQAKAADKALEAAKMARGDA